MANCHVRLERRQDSNDLRTLVMSRQIAEHQTSSIIPGPSSSERAAITDLERSDQESQQQPDTLTHPNRRAKKRQRVLKIGFASWLTGRVWLFGFNRAASGWDVSLRTLNVGGLDAPIFAACRAGDLGEVQRLTASGKASLYDTSAGYSRSPLNVRMPHVHY